jgi:hypothetical protein
VILFLIIAILYYFLIHTGINLLDSIILTALKITFINFLVKKIQDGLFFNLKLHFMIIFLSNFVLSIEAFFILIDGRFPIIVIY